MSDFVVHMYDCCPYCMKVLFTLDWLNIPYTTKIYGYGDASPSGPKGIHPEGSKVCPILEYKEDGNTKYMAETIPIMSFIDKENKLQSAVSPAIQAWLSTIMEGVFGLVMPRIRNLKTKDFQNQEDRDYHETRWSESQGWTDKLNRTEELKEKTHSALNALVPLLKTPTTVNEDGKVSPDDREILAILKLLTCLKMVEWPEQVKTYVVENYKKSNLELYFDRQF